MAFKKDKSGSSPANEERRQVNKPSRAEQRAARKAEAAEEKALRRDRKLSDKAYKAAEKDALKAKKQAAKNSPQAKSARFRLKLALIITALVLVLAFLGVTYAAYRVSTSDRNLPNVYIEEISVGGMTYEETIAALEKAKWHERTDYALSVSLPASVSFQLDAVKSGAVLDMETAAGIACSYGHDEGWYANLSKYLSSLRNSVEVTKAQRSLNESYIRAQIAEGMKLFGEKNVDEGYKLDEENNQLSFVKGAGQMVVDEEALYSQISVALLNGSTKVDHSKIDNVLQMPDFEAVYKELAVEPQDARYSETFEVIDEVIGCTFDIEEAKKLWEEAEPAELVVIPMTVTKPELTAEELRARLYRDKLGSQTTLFTYSNSNRISNITLAASKLNGLVLYPGDVFSFNDTVGKRTLEAGFKEAGAYSDGQEVQEVGGGICQVSSTLYCAAMYAQMDTVSRTNHYFRVDYLPISYDATVSWPGPDYKFKNSREYPVKLVAYTDTEAKSLTIEIWGTDTDGSYVELSYWYSDVFDEEYTEVKIGEAGICYRHVYDSKGNKIKTIQEPYSYYALHEEDIEWPDATDDDWVADILPDYDGNSGGGSEGSIYNPDNSAGGGSAAIIIPTE